MTTFRLVPAEDCKFCEFPHLAPSVYDAPELAKSHAMHLLDALDPSDPKWDEKVREASWFAR